MAGMAGGWEGRRVVERGRSGCTMFLTDPLLHLHYVYKLAHKTCNLNFSSYYTVSCKTKVHCNLRTLTRIVRPLRTCRQKYTSSNQKCIEIEDEPVTSKY